MATKRSWLQISPKCQFSIANIPFGIISTKSNKQHRPAIAIGYFALCLETFSKGDGFSGLHSFSNSISVFSQPTLNAFAALGRPVHQAVRLYLQNILQEDTSFPAQLKSNEALQRAALIPLSEVENHLPLQIGDYTDFFAGRNHAFNVGTLFRGPENALNPNYNHIPVGYHGRASSVVVSGTPIHRPWGQILRNAQAEPKVPTFSPCERLDLELELGMFICKGNELGRPIPVDSAEENIFGYVLMNDWSARDIQVWEYVPLGPFNAKNFGTTISPWVVLADTLKDFQSQGLKNDTELQPYLRESKVDNVLDINLEVDLTTSKGNTTTIARTKSKNLLWSWPQMIAHHSIGGCNLRTGDLLGSGTISGIEPGAEGSILEQTQGGKVPLQLNGGEERKFLEDGDSICLRGWVGEDYAMIGFGECVGKIEPAVRF